MIIVKQSHYNRDIIKEIKRFRADPRNRVTPEIQKIVSRFAFTTAKRAAAATKTDVDRWLADFERRYFWRAYRAIEHGDWSPERCAYKTWVVGALNLECRKICAEIGIEAVRWAKTSSLDEPVAMPSSSSSTIEVIDVVEDPSGRTFYAAIDLNDVREQLQGDVNRQIFDAVIGGVRGWKAWREIFGYSRHAWYDRIWPNFVAAVKNIIGEWRKEASYAAV